ncbi:hypothetical protein QQ045_001307 [Rhodiola kirilowii]
MAGRGAFGSKFLSCTVGMVLLVALTGEAAVVEFKDMGVCLTGCGNQVVQCATTCTLRGLQAVQCLETCGIVNLGCMGNCTGYMELAIVDVPASSPLPTNTADKGQMNVKTEIGS